MTVPTRLPEPSRRIEKASGTIDSVSSNESVETTANISAMSPLFLHFDGWFNRSPIPAKHASSSSDDSSFGGDEDDLETINFFGAGKSGNSAQSSVFDNESRASDNMSQFAADASTQGGSMSQIYGVHEAQRCKPSDSNQRRGYLSKDSASQIANSEIDTVCTSLSRIRRSWKTIRVPSRVKTSDMGHDEVSVVTGADEVSVFTAPHLSDEARKARKGRSKVRGDSPPQAQLVVVSEGSEEREDSSSSYSEISSRSRKGRLLVIPERNKELLSSEDIHTTQGFEISLQETREEEQSSSQGSRRFSLFPWPKPSCEKQKLKGSSTDKSETASRLSSEGSQKGRKRDGVENQSIFSWPKSSSETQKLKGSSIDKSETASRSSSEGSKKGRKHDGVENQSIFSWPKSSREAQKLQGSSSNKSESASRTSSEGSQKGKKRDRVENQSIFSWPKSSGETLKQKGSLTDKSETASRTSSWGSQKGGKREGVENQNTISSERRQDKAARISTRTGMFRSSSGNKLQAASSWVDSPTAERKETDDDNVSKARTSIPAVLPMPARVKKIPTASESPLRTKHHDREVGFTGIFTTNYWRRESSNPNLQNSGGDERQPTETYEVQNQPQRERVKTGSVKSFGTNLRSKSTNLDIVPSNSDSANTKPSLPSSRSMTAERSLQVKPKSILKSKSQIDTRNGTPIEDNVLSLGDMLGDRQGPNDLYEIATVPHSFSFPEGRNSPIEDERKTVKKFSLISPPRIGRVFRKSNRKKTQTEPGQVTGSSEIASSEKSVTSSRSDDLAEQSIHAKLTAYGGMQSHQQPTVSRNLGSIRPTVPVASNQPVSGTCLTTLMTATSALSNSFSTSTMGGNSDSRTVAPSTTPGRTPEGFASVSGSHEFGNGSRKSSSSDLQDTRDEAGYRGRTVSTRSVFGFKPKRNQPAGNDLRTMVKKTKAKKLMTQRFRTGLQESHSGVRRGGHNEEERSSCPSSTTTNLANLVQSPTQSNRSTGSGEDERGLLEMWPTRTKSWGVEDEKKMLEAMNKVVKRRLQAIEILEKETEFEQDPTGNSCCSLFSCGG